jgi:hypothetical protein
MSATFRGGKELHNRLEAISDPRLILRRLQIGTVAEAKRLVPRKTGNLGRTIAPGEFTGHAAYVRATAGYAAYVEKGTKPHVIRPRHKSALRFPAGGVGVTLSGRVRTGEVRSLGNGAYAFAMKVNHPGTKPKPFLLPGAKKAAAGANLKNLVVELWNKAA